MEIDRFTVAPKFSYFSDPLVLNDEDANVEHDGMILSHLVNETMEVDLGDTARDTMLCELIVLVRKNRSIQRRKEGVHLTGGMFLNFTMVRHEGHVLKQHRSWRLG